MRHAIVRAAGAALAVFFSHALSAPVAGVEAPVPQPTEAQTDSTVEQDAAGRQPSPVRDAPSPRPLPEKRAKSRKSPPAEEQVLVKFVVVELNSSRMRKAGLDAQWPPKSSDSKTIDQFIQSLVEQDLARIEASPTLCTCMDRPASFHSGGTVPIRWLQDGKESIEHKRYGTEAAVTSTVTPTGKVRVEFRLRITSIDETPSSELAEERIQAPRLRTFSIDSSIEVNSGETFVTSGLTCKKVPSDKEAAGKNDREPEDVLRCVLVTPTLIK